ncbi:polysaccharide deacetylase family protein [Halobacterium salinarum]|uniref:polysaccharide deacetylase family protein n=1 Tax=Halobacterium salinarum TaxID=2242 RepID=UPI0025551444|nr:polysaccharide deacetylase family protein [Halobacterium salinarum]MDL0131632.1 polysaccharide deacetylase family protein [Halobacterium salinarum]
MGGVVTLSIELELGWGMHDKAEYGHLSEDRTAETKALRRILDLADHHDLPITFDVVGHLLHESCTGSHTGPYPEDYWSEDPGTDRETSPHFYAPDMVRKIRKRPTDHEFATHTYSHLLADEASSAQLDNELSKVQQVYSDFGIQKPTSIVMPRHQDPDYSVLIDHGITTIRQTIPDYEPSISNPVSKLWWLLSRKHPSSSIFTEQNLVETTVTPHPSLTAVYLPSGRSQPHPVFAAIPRKVRQSLHQRYLINAIDRAVAGAHIHLWTHVYNLANDAQWVPIQKALSYLAQKYKNGDVEIKRMTELKQEW